MRRYLLILIALIIIGLVSIEVMLPRYYANLVEMGIKREVEGVEEVEVKIRTHPALLLLKGRVQNSTLRAKGITIEGVRFDRLEAWYEDLLFVNTPQGIKTFGGTNLYFRAEILEADLNHYLQTVLPQFDTVEVKMHQDKAILSAKMGKWIDFQLSGSLVVTDQYKVRFVPTDMANNSMMNLISQALSMLEFDLGLKNAPIPLDLKKIEIIDGKLQALGGSTI